MRSVEEEGRGLVLSGCIPCYNNAGTIAGSLVGLEKQTHRLGRIFVIDDASDDGSAAIAEGRGYQVIRFSRNCGRGAVRAKAIEVCQDDLLMSCDATSVLDPHFANLALPWFNDPEVAAVFGRLYDPSPLKMAARWRARHLFRQGEASAVNEHASLSTWACVLRVSYVRAVGNYKRSLRHSEDVELGKRLLEAGYKVVHEPACLASPLVSNTVEQCLERHWRWYAARHGRMNRAAFRRWLGLAWGSMVRKDFREHDISAALVSAVLPLHHYVRSRRRESVGCTSSCGGSRLQDGNSDVRVW